MEAKPIVFIDSNYCIYLFDQTTAEHQYVKDHFDKLYGESLLELADKLLFEMISCFYFFLSLLIIFGSFLISGNVSNSLVNDG